MDGIAVGRLDSGDPYFGLVLEHLHPDRSVDAELVTREMVAILTALEGRRGCRVVLQTTCHPDDKSPERGAIAVRLLGVASVGSETETEHRLADLAEDLSDALATPPLRWSFRPITDPSELQRASAPFVPFTSPRSPAREEEAPPREWHSGIGYSNATLERTPDRRLWNVWTLGPASADLRRLAAVLLSQSSPTMIRVSLAPTILSTAESTTLEQLIDDMSPLTTDRLSRSLLSAGRSRVQRAGSARRSGSGAARRFRLPVVAKNAMLRRICETLEMRVGTVLAERMSDRQLDEFEEFIKAGDEARALTWLETISDYKTVVASELESLRVEISGAAADILTAESEGST